MTSYGNPYFNNPYMQQFAQQQLPPQMPAMQPTQPQAGILVDGPNEAMNRFLMRYPANQLVPGFTSDPLFDVNGRQFHTLSVESDGRRNLETFDFVKHEEEKPMQQVDMSNFVTRAEFQGVMDKINQLMGAQDGIHGPVQTTATTPATESATQQRSPSDA